MHSNHKKKTQRVRNRPRNKINQLNKNELPVTHQQDLNISHEKENLDNIVRPISNDDILIIQQALRSRILQKQKKKVEQDQSMNETLSNKKNLNQEDSEHVKHAILTQLQKKIDKIGKKDTDLRGDLFNSLEMLMQQKQVQFNKNDMDQSNFQDEDYIEYVYQPRPYFLTSLCHFCKCDLRQQAKVPCRRCGLIYYCSSEHMKLNCQEHRVFCNGVQQVSQYNGKTSYGINMTFNFTYTRHDFEIPYSTAIMSQLVKTGKYLTYLT